MKKIFFFCCLLASLFLTSCLTYLDDKDIHFKPRLVLYCRLVAQYDTTILQLSHTVSAFSGSNRKIEEVKNAIVEISDDNQHWVKMEYNTPLQYYYVLKTVFPINEGKTYYVRAAAPSYDEVSASCTVPCFRETHLKPVYVESDKDTHWGQAFNEPHKHLFLEWDDYPGENNYYTFFFNNLYYDFNEETGEIIPMYYDWEQISDMNSKVKNFSDLELDGKKISMLFTALPNNMYPLHFDITMVQMDKHSYSFEKSYNSEKVTDDMMSVFLLEPTQVYTNIKNGYGLFCALAMKDYSF